MKKIKYILIALLLSFSFSCSDFLDITPSGQTTDETLWTSKASVEKYMASIYAGIPMPQLHQDDPWVGCSDEADLTWSVYVTYAMNQGNWAEGIDYYNKYNNWYYAIRQSFVLENNIDRCSELTGSEIKRMKGEAKFLRGYFYWLLLRQYGPLVLIKKQANFDDDFSQIMRSPYDDCVKYICQMMDDAEDNLPLHWWDDTANLGRPNKIICKSMKAVVLHHAASPQFNGNSEYVKFKNPDDTPLINTTYEEQKWKDAAAAAYEVIKIAKEQPNILHLYKNTTDGGDDVFNPYKSVVEVQLTGWNKEVIFGRARGNSLRGWMIHAAPGPSSLGGVGATQRLVDAFLMENGKPIDYPASGYVKEGWTTTGGSSWNPNNHDVTSDEGKNKIITDIRNSDAWGHWPNEWNTFANREPRFYGAILYNKRIIPALPNDVVRRDYFSSVGQQNGLGRVELYYGGMSRSSGNYTFFPRTGYLAFKKVDPLSEMGNEAERRWPREYVELYLRYATILLNYIEALNEYNPNHPDIREYWDLIRERAGVPSAFVATPDIKGDKELQREYIIRERMVELCFEGDRYFTTRRLWLAHREDKSGGEGYERYGEGGKMYGLSISTGNEKTNNFGYEGFYRRTAFEERVFRKEFYLFPLPKAEVDKGEGKMVQNPWWR